VANYRIEINRRAACEIERIGQRRDRERIVARIAKLVENLRPVGSVKLSRQEAYRIRQGNYRIVYTIEDDILLVMVVRVGHRRDV
jgi:mRNA interferase RelE/StbE